jgi:hypothetical protein
MIEIAGSIYIAATAAFVLAACVIGVRLILLHRRTRQAPEGLLGWGLLSSGGLGYGLMIFSALRSQVLLAAGTPSDALAFVSGLGWVIHNVGVLLMLRFVVIVYRPQEKWARVLAIAAGCVLWGGWAVFVAQGGLSGTPVPAYWVTLAVIGTFPLWSMSESFSYWRRMKLRVSLGLADPLVCNRFFLWTLASLTSLGSIWTVNLPLLIQPWLSHGAFPGAVVMSLLVTALFGLATVSLYWLTFFPPAWYRALVVPTAAAK